MARDAEKALVNPVAAAGSAENPRSKSPSCGAAAGRSVRETPMTTIKTAARILKNPIHMTQDKWEILRMDANMMVKIMATTLKTMVHVACVETVLSAIVRPKILVPVARIQVKRYKASMINMEVVATLGPKPHSVAMMLRWTIE